MNFYNLPKTDCVKALKSDISFGLNNKNYNENVSIYGLNKIKQVKKKSLFKRITNQLTEPLMIILLIGLVITLGINIGSFIKGQGFDWGECVGIFLAIFISVSLSVLMESNSLKAFESLNKLYDEIKVNVIRFGKIQNIEKENITVGDIILLNSGDKIVADGRIVESNNLYVDESSLTGESLPVKKDCDSILKMNTPLAERINCVFSGTFVKSGNGKMIVSAIGDKTEMGCIADEISFNINEKTPLNVKLNKLSKIISIVGIAFASLLFIFNLIGLIIDGQISFNNIQSLFVSCVVLIIASVPEGLPTIVALSLAINMIKLAKEDALIKKITATETCGAISVICTDKTGTLTNNKLNVEFICKNNCQKNNENVSNFVYNNVFLNSTVVYDDLTKNLVGNATECALLNFFDYKKLKEYRNKFKVEKRIPFSSENKYMSTTIIENNISTEYIKGAPEIIVERCFLNEISKKEILSLIESYQKKSNRIICFAHSEKDKVLYDGFAVLSDGIREDVKRSIKDCLSAGIRVIMLTGDNITTAYSIALKTNIASTKHQCINGFELEKLKDDDVKKLLNKITVISRCTPTIKLRVVKLLKESGEVVAVTGDGINDAPALKHADVGFSMGSGSEICKDASDVVLLNDSFSTLTKAISFGRNVYQNIQRFILFQLTVNISALLFIFLTEIFNLKTPFNTLQLLWINIIMDGPPALSLGLLNRNKNILNNKPIKKNKSIVTKAMFFRIVLTAIIITLILFFQYVFNFLNVKNDEMKGSIFSLFILCQLFNALNCRVLGFGSSFEGLKKDKILILTIIITFIIQVLINQVLYMFFNIMPLSFITWIKIILVSSLILLTSEIYKKIYRDIKN